MRFTLHWDAIATTRPADPTDPNDPAYAWEADDDVLQALRGAGISVVLQLLGTPGWANRGAAPNVAPVDSADFHDFAAAAAQRYPWVRRWVIWNEPNQRLWLRPTTPAVYTTRLLNPAYSAIHATIAGAQVAGGATAPRGGAGGVSPVAWIAGMKKAHARLDAYAHNPYPLNPKRETPTTGGCGHCQTITMATIGSLVSLVARDFPRARIWLTEWGYQSNPPDRLLGVSPGLQARYIGQADWLASRTPRVDMLLQFLYQDETALSRWQSGLVTAAGVEKPAFAAFQLPLAATVKGATATVWGQLRAPEAGTSAILERRVGSSWRVLARLSAATGGFVSWQGSLPRGSIVRLSAGGLVSPPLAVV